MSTRSSNGSPIALTVCAAEPMSLVGLKRHEKRIPDRCLGAVTFEVVDHILKG